FEDSPIFVSGHDGINTYRIPSIIATSNGTILVFCEGRRDSYVDGTATNLVLKRSLGNSVASIPAHGSKTAGSPTRGEKMIWQPMQVLLATKAGEAYRSEEHTSELQSLTNLVCRLPLEKKNNSHTTRSPSMRVHQAWGALGSSR